MISRVPTATIRQLAGELGRLIDAGAGDPADEHILKYARTLERQLLTVLDERHRAETDRCDDCGTASATDELLYYNGERVCADCYEVAARKHRFHSADGPVCCAECNRIADEAEVYERRMRETIGGGR